ncbi:LysE family transporter [Lutimonas saemankumensis]|uniref:LysE family translocator n=1 Tax=Lutimonas saemankumensis TaxID=483016 RepID=UPI001CD1C39A|nr:LysE family transporter [Lutimonas saemankumensis]MCA0932411.1 LysE family transporter [Lutimonas saemankumensis]
MFNEYVNAVLLGFGLAFMVGPVFFTLIETSITKGMRAAITFDIGVILADIMFIIVSYFGSITILERIQDDPRIFMVGGLALVSYGLYTIFYRKTKKIVTDEELVVVESNNYLTLFLKGFFLNTINFGVLAFWLAIVIAVSSNFQMDTGRVFKYFVLVILTFLITDFFKILAAKQLKAKLTPVVLRKIRHALGVFFIIFGIILAAKRYIPEKTMDKIDDVIEKVRS